MFRNVSDEELLEAYEQGSNAILPIIEEWQSEGELRDVEPRILAHAIRTLLLGLVEVRQFEDDDDYERVREVLFDTFAAGIVETRDG